MCDLSSYVKIHLKQIIQVRRTKAEIDMGNTLEYDVNIYQEKKRKMYKQMTKRIET